jgi:hypothetical protein
VADAVTAGTTTVTSVTGGFTTAMIGNGINIVGDGIYQITAWASTNSITVDRNTGTSAAQTANVGGALLTLGKLAGAMVASNKAFVTGAFTGSGVTFAQSGAPTAAAPATRLIGYGVTRGDAAHATFALTGATGQTAINCTGTGFQVEKIDIDCGSLVTSTGITVGLEGLIRFCKVANFATAGLNTAGIFAVITDCEVTGGLSNAIGVSGAGQSEIFQRCFIHDNACSGMVVSNGSAAFFNLVVNNSGAVSDGIRATVGTTILNNTVHNNGRSGINVLSSGSYQLNVKNNVMTNNGTFGLVISNATAQPADPAYDGNAYGGGASANTSGAISPAFSTTGIYGVNPYTNTRDVTLSVSPYVGPTTGSTANFGLNNTTGGGKSVRGKGSPGPFPGLTTTVGALDMGAVQSGPSGSSTPISSGGGPPYIISST